MLKSRFSGFQRGLSKEILLLPVPVTGNSKGTSNNFISAPNFYNYILKKPTSHFVGVQQKVSFSSHRENINLWVIKFIVIFIKSTPDFDLSPDVMQVTCSYYFMNLSWIF